MIYCATSDNQGKRAVRFLNGTYNKPWSGLTDIYKYWDLQVGEVAPAYAREDKTEILAWQDGHNSKMIGRQDLYGDYLPPVVGEVYLLMKSDTKYYDKYRIASRGITELTAADSVGVYANNMTRAYAQSNACLVGLTNGGHYTPINFDDDLNVQMKYMSYSRYGRRLMNLVKTDGPQIGARTYNNVLSKPSRGYNSAVPAYNITLNEIRSDGAYGAIHSHPCYFGSHQSKPGLDMLINGSAFIVRDFHTSGGDTFDALFVVNATAAASITILNLRDGNWFDLALPSTMQRYNGVYVSSKHKVYIFQSYTGTAGKVQIIDCATGLASEVTGKSIACGGYLPFDLAILTDGKTIIGHDSGTTGFTYDTDTDTGTNHVNAPSAVPITPAGCDTYLSSDGNPRGNEVFWVISGSSSLLCYNESTGWSLFSGVSDTSDKTCLYIDKRTGKAYMPCLGKSSMHLWDAKAGSSGYSTINLGLAGNWAGISVLGAKNNYGTSSQIVFAIYPTSGDTMIYYNIDSGQVTTLAKQETSAMFLYRLPTTGTRIFAAGSFNAPHLFKNYNSLMSFDYYVASAAYGTSGSGKGGHACWCYDGHYGMSLAHHLWRLTGNSFWFHRYLVRSFKNQLY